MVSAISTSMIHWTQMAFLEPTNEGIARINRCIRGVNLHRSDWPKIAWSERVVDLLTGLVLMIPLLNLVVWIFMKTWGNAELLSTPFNHAPVVPWTDAINEAKTRIVAKAAAQPPAVGEIPKVDKYEAMDQVNKENPVKGSWEIKTYKGSHIGTRKSEVDSSKSVYTLEWDLQEYEYKNKSKEIDVHLTRNENIITLDVKQNPKDKKFNKKFTFKLEDPSMPLIQQPSMGLRAFIISKKRSMNFYAIDPSKGTPILKEFTVTRGDEKEHPTFPKYGKAVCITICQRSGLLGYISQAVSTFTNLYESWHDPKTGQQFTSDYNIPYFISGNSRLMLPN